MGPMKGLKVISLKVLIAEFVEVRVFPLGTVIKIS